MEKMSYSFTDGVAWITLDDGKANAQNWMFFEGMQQCLDFAERDAARALVITGRPGFFSGGLDLKLVPTLSGADLQKFVADFSRMILRLYAFPMPTVAVLTGHAIAGGALLSFACDTRVALDGPFKLQVNEVKIGIPLPEWAMLLADAAIPNERHVEALLHAKAYTPAEAATIGIVPALAPDAAALAQLAEESVAELLVLNLPAYAATKHNFRHAAVAAALAQLPDSV